MANKNRNNKPSSSQTARQKKNEPNADSHSLWQDADRLVQEAIPETDFGYSSARTFPVFDASEIIIGSFLGEGAFGIVHQVEAFRLKPQSDDENTTVSTTRMALQEDDDSDNHYDIEEARSIMKENVRRNGDARYAIKRLRKDDLDDRETARGMIDLYIEVRVLERLFHPNIVKMRGMSSAINQKKTADFFFLMDRLYGTLQDKLAVWRQELPKRQGGWFKTLSSGKQSSSQQKQQLKESLLTRITVAYDLSCAFSYMHKRQLVYRDIKVRHSKKIHYLVLGLIAISDALLSWNFLL